MTTFDCIITYTERENANEFPQDCVFALCPKSLDEVGPVWGHGRASVLRALAMLTEECSCGADFHKEKK
jgi:hypothetical protein